MNAMDNDDDDNGGYDCQDGYDGNDGYHEYGDNEQE